MRRATMRKPHPERSDVVVVGGGVAAGACVTTLRESGFDGTITVACAEPHPPYTRPGLTKQVLRGEKPAAAALWRPEEWYRDQSVVLLTGATASAIAPSAHTIEVAGRRLSYGSLVLATGARPRHIDFAASAALTGSDVSLVMAEDVMLERAFGQPVGAWFEVRLRRRGVRICAGTSVESIMRADDEL